MARSRSHVAQALAPARARLRAPAPTGAFGLLAILVLSGALVGPGAAHGTTGAHATWTDADAWTDPPQSFGPDPEAALRAAEQAGLFGPWDPTAEAGGYAGAFVAVTLPADHAARSLALDGTVWLADLDLGPVTSGVETIGPALTRALANGTLTIHNNPHAWVTARGSFPAAEFTFAPGIEVRATADGLIASRGAATMHVRVAEPSTWGVAVDGATGRLTFDAPFVRLHMTHNEPWQQADWDGTLEAGAWILAAHADGSTYIDRLRMDQPGYDTTEVGNDFWALETHRDAHTKDRALWLESVGLFASADRAAQQARVEAKRFFRDHDAHTLYTAAAPLSRSNITYEDDRSVWALRVERILDGMLILETDQQAPDVTNVRFDGLEPPWEPQTRVPTLTSATNEPAFGTLRIDLATGSPWEKRTTTAAYTQTFRLLGLGPDTTYTYHLEVQDHVGNRRTSEGTFATPEAQDRGAVAIEVRRPADDGTHDALDGGLHARVTYEDGTPVDTRYIQVILDQRPLTQRITPLPDGQFQVEPGRLDPGTHTYVIDVRAPGAEQRIQQVTFTIGTAQDSPAPDVLVVVGALALAGMGRRRIGT